MRSVPGPYHSISVKEDVFGGYGVFASRDIPKGTFVLVEKPVVCAFDLQTTKVCRWCGRLNPDTTIKTCSECIKVDPLAFDCISNEEDMQKSGAVGSIFNILLMRLLQVEKSMQPKTSVDGKEGDEDEEESVPLTDEDIDDIVKKTPTKLHKLDGEDESFISNIPQELRDEPYKCSDFRIVTNLQSHPTYTSIQGISKVKFNEEVASRSHIETLMKICNNNTFMVNVVDKEKISIGRFLFAYASFFNHSCTPTCQWKIVEGQMYVRTLVDVASGEELTINYWDDDFLQMTVSSRQVDTFGTYGFICTCPDCKTCKKCHKEPEKFCSKCQLAKYCDKCDRKNRMWWKQHARPCTELVRFKTMLASE